MFYNQSDSRIDIHILNLDKDDDDNDAKKGSKVDCNNNYGFFTFSLPPSFNVEVPSNNNV